MTSYQHDVNKGGYEPINGDGIHPEVGKSKKKWMISGVIAVIVAVVLAVALRKPAAGASTKVAMDMIGLPIDEDGSIMLFDDLSKFLN